MAGSTPDRKPLHWVGSSLRDIRRLPEDVKDMFGFALDTAQLGGRHIDAKILKGFGGASVLEVVVDDDGKTYRAVYTVKLKSAIYVLHVFQKKSTKGIKTPQIELDLIEQRLKDAIVHHKEMYEQNKKEERKT